MGEEPDGQLRVAGARGGAALSAVRHGPPRGRPAARSWAAPAFRAASSIPVSMPIRNKSWVDAIPRLPPAIATAARTDYQLPLLRVVSVRRPVPNTGEPAICWTSRSAWLQALRGHFGRARVSPYAIPWIISEYGYSAFIGRDLVELPSALLNADIVGQFLSLGGKTAYLYGYEPGRLTNQVKRCAGYGKWMLLRGRTTLRDERIGRCQSILLPAAHPRMGATRSNQPHSLYAASSDIRDHRGRQIVTAYAVRAQTKSGPSFW